MSELQRIFCSGCGEQIEIDIDELDSDIVFCVSCGMETDISALREQSDEDDADENVSAENEDIEEKLPLPDRIICPSCGEQIDIDPDELDSDILFCISCGKEAHISELSDGYDEVKAFDDADTSADLHTHNPNAPAPIFMNVNSQAVHTAVHTNTIYSSPHTNNTFSHEPVNMTVNNGAAHTQPVGVMNNNPFESVSETEKKEIDNRINSRVRVWQEAIKSSSDNSSEFTDKFAHGMPEWDLTPPDMLIQRRKAMSQKQ